jgi:hypothetical protein
MRKLAAASFAYPISHTVKPLPVAAIEAAVDTADLDDQLNDSYGQAPDMRFDAPVGVSRDLSRDVTCHAIASVARGHDLPVPFFANLIWQESNFNPRDISRAGAQGIAQFMPGTAVDYGLMNPFEPIHALNTAARFLNELHARFGNLGLAAAAYNAGPRRITNWMTKGGPLPRETRDYVLRITGKPAGRWIEADVKDDPESAVMPAKAPCAEVTEAVLEQKRVVRVAKLMMSLAQTTKPSPPNSDKPAGTDAKVGDAKPAKSARAAKSRSDHAEASHGPAAGRAKEVSEHGDKHGRRTKVASSR